MGSSRITTGRRASIPSVALLACWVSIGAVGAATSPGHAPAAARPTTGFDVQFPNASPLAKAAGRAADEAVATAGTGDLATAIAQADAAFDLITRYGTARDIDAFREAAYARRLVHQMADAPDDTRGDLLTYLQAHPALSHTLAFTVGPKDYVPGVYDLLDRLRRERPKQLDRLPDLAVALCVVRDKPLRRHMNENTVGGADPVAVFDFYAAHEGQMFYGLRGVPVELLCHVVDTTASIADMTWALGKYAGNRDVGSLFFTISYDYDYYNGKAQKKVDVAPGGYGLPNILKCGGVCVDQAYFATSVGKAIGVPTAIATASSADAGHAWVGFLKSNGKTAGWDFNAGRYEAYRGLRGDVTDPQTGETVADSTVGLLGDLIGTTPVQRQDVVALTDAAQQLAADEDPPAYPATALARPATKPPPARAATADGQLELIELGLRQFAAHPPAWRRVADLASDGKLSEPQKHRWADLALRMCGPHHPDFAVSILSPMIESVADAREQSGLWDAVYKLVQARPDLAAEVRFRQASLWEKQHDLPQAGRCYADVIDHDLNAGPFAVRALKGAASVLHKLGEDGRVLDLYAGAAKAVVKPGMAGQAEFLHQSNWYKIREAYAAQLAEAGQADLAERIRDEDKAG